MSNIKTSGFSYPKLGDTWPYFGINVFIEEDFDVHFHRRPMKYGEDIHMLFYTFVNPVHTAEHRLFNLNTWIKNVELYDWLVEEDIYRIKMTCAPSRGNIIYYITFLFKDEDAVMKFKLTWL